MVATPVVPETGMHWLMDIADPMAQELERRQSLLVGRIGRGEHGDVGPDCRHHTLVRQRARIVAEPVRVARGLTKCSAARCRGRSGQLQEARKRLNSVSSRMSAITRWRAMSSSSRNASSQTVS
jgi:hypothetical protein